MSEEELKNLAREYAHLRAFDGGFFPKEDEIAGDFEVCLQLLSKDYCIVPKSKVKKWHDSAKETADYFPNSPRVSPLNRAKVIVDVLKEIFGSELFEQKGE